MSEDEPIILFDGGKTVWKTRTNLNVVLAFHPKIDIVEIIAYDHGKGVEAPRLYVKYSLLATKVDTDDICDKILVERELSIRHHKTVINTEVKLKLIQEAAGQYLLNRINVAGSLAERMNHFEIYLEPSHEDVINPNTGKIDYEQSAPPQEMEEYYIKRAPHRTFTFFRRELTKFEIESEELRTETEAANGFVDILETHLEREQLLAEKAMNTLAQSLISGGTEGKNVPQQESVNPSSVYRNTFVGNHYFGYVSKEADASAATGTNLRVYETPTDSTASLRSPNGGGAGSGESSPARDRSNIDRGYGTTTAASLAASATDNKPRRPSVPLVPAASESAANAKRRATNYMTPIGNFTPRTAVDGGESISSKVSATPKRMTGIIKRLTKSSDAAEDEDRAINNLSRKTSFRRGSSDRRADLVPEKSRNDSDNGYNSDSAAVTASNMRRADGIAMHDKQVTSNKVTTNRRPAATSTAIRATLSLDESPPPVNSHKSLMPEGTASTDSAELRLTVPTETNEVSEPPLSIITVDIRTKPVTQSQHPQTQQHIQTPEKLPSIESSSSTTAKSPSLAAAVVSIPGAQSLGTTRLTGKPPTGGTPGGTRGQELPPFSPYKIPGGPVVHLDNNYSEHVMSAAPSSVVAGTMSGHALVPHRPVSASGGSESGFKGSPRKFSLTQQTQQQQSPELPLTSRSHDPMDDRDHSAVGIITTTSDDSEDTINGTSLPEGRSRGISMDEGAITLPTTVGMHGTGKGARVGYAGGTKLQPKLILPQPHGNEQSAIFSPVFV